MTKPFTPTRLREKGPYSGLLQAASAFEPPPGAEARILRALELRHAPLAASDPDPALANLLREASAAAEPAPDAAERIFRRLTEEADARAGVAEPRRLLDGSGAAAKLLAEAARMEPPAGRRTRTWMRVAPPRPAVRPWAFGAFATAAMAALVFALWPSGESLPPAPPAPTPLAFTAPEAVSVQHAGPGAPGAVTVGDTLALQNASDARFSILGVGEVVLAGSGARLAVRQSDSHGVRLELTGGTVAIHAEKRRREAPLVVAAQGVLVKVVGTIFAVSSTPAGVSVATREGLVEVTRPDGVFHVGAGESLAAGDLEVHRGLGAPWAEPFLGALAGEPEVAAPAGIAHRETLVPKAVPLRPGLLAPRPAPLVSQPVAAEPVPQAVAETVEPAPPARPFEQRIDLAALSQDLLGRPVAELRGIGSEAARRGDVRRQAAALYATLQASDLRANRAEVANNVVQLATLLDVELAAPAQALEYWRGLAQKTESKRAEARFHAQLIALETAGVTEAREAVNDCLAQCADDQKDIARWLQAMVLRDTETYPAALRQAATNAPFARHPASLTLQNRARELSQRGQLSRARIDARFAAELEPGSLAPDVAALLRD